MADDGKRSEAEWTLYGDGIEERGVPGGERTRIGRGRYRIGDQRIRSKNGNRFYWFGGRFWGSKMFQKSK